MKGYIKPCWNMEDFYNLPYCEAPFYNDDQINEYVSCGHTKKHMMVHKYHEPNPMPSCIKEKIIPQFSSWTNVTSAINLFNPGTYLPYHNDSFLKYKKIFDITSEDIVRSVIMLEDWQPGQIILIEDKSYSGWKSGQYWVWKNNTKHSFYNMSLVKRYALQLTGTIK
jgi:hypothetical protein